MPPKLASVIIVANGQLQPLDNDAVAVLAYEFWIARGCLIGSPEVDWFQAEEELRARNESPTEGEPLDVLAGVVSDLQVPQDAAVASPKRRRKAPQSDLAAVAMSEV